MMQRRDFLSLIPVTAVAPLTPIVAPALLTGDALARHVEDTIRKSENEGLRVVRTPWVWFRQERFTSSVGLVEGSVILLMFNEKDEWIECSWLRNHPADHFCLDKLVENLCEFSNLHKVTARLISEDFLRGSVSVCSYPFDDHCGHSLSHWDNLQRQGWI